jgi:hypothetical protein
MLVAHEVELSRINTQARSCRARADALTPYAHTLVAQRSLDALHDAEKHHMFGRAQIKAYVVHCHPRAPGV